MVVGEPSLMGGEFGDEDERLITRLENTQYDAANNLDPHSHDAAGGPPPHPHQFHSEPTPGNSWPPDRGPGPPQGGPGSQVNLTAANPTRQITAHVTRTHTFCCNT